MRSEIFDSNLIPETIRETILLIKDRSSQSLQGRIGRTHRLLNLLDLGKSFGVDPRSLTQLILGKVE